jgi:hypothetical protein
MTQAAAQGKPFKAVLYVTKLSCCLLWFVQVVDKYDPSKSIKTWPKDKSTDFALQYGKKDDLAPPELSLELEEGLREAGLSLKVGSCRGKTSPGWGGRVLYSTD